MVPTCTSPKHKVDRSAERAIDPITHFIIIRDDLPPGLAAAQVAHAAGESVAGHAVDPGTYAVILECSPKKLADFRVRIERARIPHAAIVEDDPPYSGALMAIGLCPAPRSIYRQATKRFRPYASGKDK